MINTEIKKTKKRFILVRGFNSFGLWSSGSNVEITGWRKASYLVAAIEIRRERQIEANEKGLGRK